MKTVHKYTLTAVVSGAIEYDPANPESYTAALKAVADKRATLKQAGADVTEKSGPAKVRT